jgi:Tol biopolymer transport system component
LYRKSLRLFGIFAFSLLAACGSPQPSTETPAALVETVTTSAQQPTETATPTEAAFQMPVGRLLVYENLDATGKYEMIDLSDLSVESYAPLNSSEWFVDWQWSLSPNGKFLAYDRSVNQDYARQTLYLLNIETGESRMIGDHSHSNGTPTWTADGRLLEFDNYDQGITIYDTQTGNAKHIDVNARFSDASAISPAGDRIAFKGGCPREGISCPVDLYMINTDGSDERFIEKGWTDYIFWSRDSREIYYSLFGDRDTYGEVQNLTDAGYDLYVFNLDSGTSQTVSDEKYQTSAPDFSYLSPNGEFLLYQFGDAGLYLVRASDYSTIELLPSGYHVWSPDSHYIAVASWEGEWTLYDVQTGTSTTIEPNIPSGSQVVGWLP